MMPCSVRLALVATLFLVSGASFPQGKLRKKGEPAQVLGQLAKVVEPGPIYAQPDKASTVYHRTKREQHLVVQNASETGWMRVTMSGGGFGYIERFRVRELSYRVLYTPAARHGQSGNTGTAASKRGADRIAAAAQRWVGEKARKGGESLATGFGNAEFVRAVLRQAGAELPRPLKLQAKVGQPIKRLEHLRRGDRLYFVRAGTEIDYTGIYLGGHSFVHADPASGKVAVGTLSANWLNRLVAARR